MHVEIQVALNFLISFLYNKLPRRRVNQFGEELENALKMKFEGHWYPDKPYKGSAFRCLKTTPPLDPVFEMAARECGMDLSDIQENLAHELSIWIDPGEVSYRMSEKGPVKILYSESDRLLDPDNPDREVTRTFNPEAQCFKPIETLASQFGSISMSAGNTPPTPFGASPPIYKSCSQSGSSSSTSSSGGSGGSNGFISKSSNPVTFTTATFAQTKFGSTKLKTNGKRSHRMSPTEFSNYIKQRALIQQQQAAAVAAVAVNGGQSTAGGLSSVGTPQLTSGNFTAATGSGSPHTSRSISPVSNPLDSVNNFMLLAATGNSSLNPSSPTASNGSNLSGYPATQPSHYSGRLVSSPVSNRNLFSNAMFDNNCLIDLLGTSVGKGQPPSTSPTTTQQHQQQQQHHHQQQQQQQHHHHHHQQQHQPPQQQTHHHQQSNHQHQQQSNALSRFASFLDKASPYVSAPSTSLSGATTSGGGGTTGSSLNYGGFGDESPTSTSPSNNAAKALDNFNFNLNSVSYPNQYQHLLVAI